MRPPRRLLASLWRPLVQGLRTLFSREASDDDLADEVAHFMDEAEADLVARGARPEDARRTVRLRYGPQLAAREQVRSYGWESRVEELRDDLRLSVRRLMRAPAFTLAAVLTTALGIGAATAIYSVVRPVLFDGLPYPEADRIVVVSDRAEDGSSIPVAFGTFRELVERTDAFTSRSVFKPWAPTLTGVGDPAHLSGHSVSAEHFEVLGVRPALGSGLDPSADGPGGPLEVVLGHGLWVRRFGSDPTVLGRVLRLDGDAYSVVGVMPRGFRDATAGDAEVWTLLQYDPLERDFQSREWGHHLGMIARLAPHAELAEVRRALDGISASPVASFPRPPWASLERGLTVDRLQERVNADARPIMQMLLGAVALVVLVAGVNVAMLVMGRAWRRGKELAMREALGAGKGRIVRHLLVESLLLAGLGGVSGILLADVMLTALVAAGPGTLPALAEASLDPGALGVALLLTTILGLAFGLTPAWVGWRREDSPLPAPSTRRSSTSPSLRRGLVVTEVAVAIMLLLGAGLVLRSTHRLLTVPPGFESEHLLVMRVHGSGLDAGDAETHRFFDGSLGQVQNAPGVLSAALTSQLPLSGESELYGVTRADTDRPEEPVGAAYRYAVSPGYFETMDIRRVRGRTLASLDDAQSAPVAVVSETLADRLFPGGGALGRRIHVGPVTDEPFTVVGVVSDVKQSTLGHDQRDAVYIPSHQWHWADPVRWVVARTDGAQEDLLPVLRRAVWAVDSDLPVTRGQTMEAVVNRSEAQRRLVLVVLLAFALAALGLAAIGIYGVVAASVTDRAHELGVRAALGASPPAMAWMVLRQGMVLVAVGGTLGVLGAGAVSGALSTVLFEVTRVDPLTHAAVALLVALVGAAACWIPASRAARVDPVATLRSE